MARMMRLPFREQVSEFAKNRAAYFAFIVLASYLILLTVPDLLGSNTFNKGKGISDASDVIAHLPFETVLLLSIAFLITFARLWSSVSIRSFAKAHQAYFWCALTLPLIVLVISGLQVHSAESLTELFNAFPVSSFALLALMSLFIAAFEELLFRGVLQTGISQRYGEIKAVVFAAILFGLAHYANWVHGKPFLETSVQVVTAFTAGLLLGALRLTTGSIWPSIIVHASWDFSVFFMGKVHSTLQPEDTGSDVVISSVLAFVIIAKPTLAMSFLLTHITEKRRALARSTTP